MVQFTSVALIKITRSSRKSAYHEVRLDLILQDLVEPSNIIHSKRSDSQYVRATEPYPGGQAHSVSISASDLHAVAVLAAVPPQQRPLRGLPRNNVVRHRHLTHGHRYK
jgi:hypothetical protein